MPSPQDRPALSVPEAAVEAAAATDPFWDGLTDEEKDRVRNEVRRCITAALPHLATDGRLEAAITEFERRADYIRPKIPRGDGYTAMHAGVEAYEMAADYLRALLSGED